ncbi:AfsR/SARP family transcriptional regulator [Rhodococcoides trifolii]|nr:BTAD domain-containing putative transcriptional regulator [Rhodococcus trifolii]
MEYRLLGQMDVRGRSGPVPLGGLKQRTVLASLLLDHERAVDADRLIDDVWGPRPPAKAIVSLRAYLTNLRRVLHEPGVPPRIVTTSIGYRLDLGQDFFDVEQFRALAERGRRSLDTGNASGADRLFTAALRLWRERPTQEFDLARGHRDRWEDDRAGVVEGFVAAALDLGRHTEIVDDIEAQLRRTPLRETLWCQLMIALHRGSRRAEALAVYGRAASAFFDAADLAPGERLEETYRRVRAHDQTLEWSPVRVVEQLVG